MKKLLPLLCAILILLNICACSAAKEAMSKSTVKALPSVTISPSAMVTGTVPNQPLTEYLRDMLDWKNNLWKVMDAKYKNTTTADYFTSINAPDYLVNILPMFDTLTLTGSGTNRREGKLMLSGIPAYTQTDANTMTFGFDFTYDQDTTLYKKGTVETAKGILDFKRQTLFYEDTVKSENSPAAKTVVEIIKNSKGYTYQYLYSSNKQNFLSGVFCQISKDSFQSYCGTKPSGVSFDYESLLSGSKNLSDIEQGFTLNLKAYADATSAEISN